MSLKHYRLEVLLIVALVGLVVQLATPAVISWVSRPQPGKFGLVSFPVSGGELGGLCYCLANTMLDRQSTHY